TCAYHVNIALSPPALCPLLPLPSPSPLSCPLCRRCPPLCLLSRLLSPSSPPLSRPLCCHHRPPSVAGCHHNAIYFLLVHAGGSLRVDIPRRHGRSGVAFATVRRLTCDWGRLPKLLPGSPPPLATADRGHCHPNALLPPDPAAAAVPMPPLRGTTAATPPSLPLQPQGPCMDDLFRL
ncbi:hypothetical protein BGW80DRAFT_1322534, partial [Lactifluus volemus]